MSLQGGSSIIQPLKVQEENYSGKKNEESNLVGKLGKKIKVDIPSFSKIRIRVGKLINLDNVRLWQEKPGQEKIGWSKKGEKLSVRLCKKLDPGGGNSFLKETNGQHQHQHQPLGIMPSELEEAPPEAISGWDSISCYISECACSKNIDELMSC